MHHNVLNFPNCLVRHYVHVDTQQSTLMLIPTNLSLEDFIPFHKLYIYSNNIKRYQLYMPAIKFAKSHFYPNVENLNDLYNDSYNITVQAPRYIMMYTTRYINY